MLLFINCNDPIAIRITILSSSPVSNFIPTPNIQNIPGQDIWWALSSDSTFSLQSQFCFKPKRFSQLIPHQQPFLPEIRGPVLVDLHQVITPESPPWSRAWWSTAQRTSQSGGPPLAETYNTTIHLWLRRLRLGRHEGCGMNRVPFHLPFPQ